MKHDDPRARRDGIRNFTTLGQVRHTLGPWMPNGSNPPTCLQLYIYDVNHELANRLDNLHRFTEGAFTVNDDVVATLQGMLHRVNPHVQAFKYAAEQAHESATLRVTTYAGMAADL